MLSPIWNFVGIIEYYVSDSSAENNIRFVIPNQAVFT